MIIFPAIDLRLGKCVRLFKGDMNQATIFNDNPAKQAKLFEDEGFKFLHVVDLDGAFAGKSINEEAIKNIIKSIKMPIQLGGGIRSFDAIEYWLELGINRVILGTIAAKNPALVIEACKKFPKQIVVGIDALNGKVATEGWAKESEIKAIELGKRFADCGVEAIIYTDISRDGTLTGVDLYGTKAMAIASNIPVIASGGVSSINDIIKIKELEPFGVCGSIVGRALYDKKISSDDLIRIQNEK